METSVRVRCGAKLNLFLRVIGRRPDGFHELRSIFHAIDLADQLEMRSLDDDRITVEAAWADGLEGSLPAGRENIVERAAYEFQAHADVQRGAALSLVKRIPIGAGLGGGSSDAAGALAGLSRLWGIRPGTADRLAPRLGSDVPFCLRGGSTALVTGRGENVAPLTKPSSPLWFVLGMSDAALLTENVYAAFAARSRNDVEGPADDASAVDQMASAVAAGDPAEVAALLRNDLEQAAHELRPEIASGKGSLLEAGALGAAVAGSGPSVFGVARDEAHARSLASDVASVFDRVEVAHSSAGCVGFD